MSVLYIPNNKSNLDSRETEKLLHKCFTIAAQRVGSMRGAYQGDMQQVVQRSKIKKAS